MTFIQSEENLEQIEKGKNKMEQELELANYKLGQIKTENEDVSKRKAQVAEIKIIEAEALEKLTKEKEKIRAKISTLISSRMQQDKNFKASQNKDHDLSMQNVE